MAVAPHRWMYIAPRHEGTYIYSVWAIVYLLLRPCEKPNLKINKYSSHTFFLWLLQREQGSDDTEYDETILSKANAGQGA